jgi:hypothetical protein
MTKYTVASRRTAGRKETPISPLWRGIGCILMVVVPVISYFIAGWLVRVGVDQQWLLSYQLVGYPVVSPTLWKVGSLAPLWGFIQSQPNLYAVLLFTVLLIVAIGTAVSVIYAAIYRVVGPPRYGPLDMPPEKGPIKRYKR